MGTDRPNVSQEVLNSWKEIARYLKRGIRTVQRWERELNLPVRRPRAGGRSPVIALCGELDLWLQSRSLMLPEVESKDSNSFERLPAVQTFRQLQIVSQQLRAELLRSRTQLKDAIYDLHATVEKIAAVSPPPQSDAQSQPTDRVTGAI